MVKKTSEPRIIFIVGSSRSGTTMMAQMLGRHSMVYSFNEIHLFDEMCEPKESKELLSQDEAIVFANRLFNRQRKALSRFTGDSDPNFLEDAQALISQISAKERTPIGVYKCFLLEETNRNQKLIPAEQTPQNVFYLTYLLHHFPNAVFINMVRDARDVMLSQQQKWRRFFGGKNHSLRRSLLFWASFHPISQSITWNSAINAARHFEGHAQVMTVQFEQLLANPNECLLQICAFAGITFSPDMLIVPANSSFDSKNDIQMGIRLEPRLRWKTVKNKTLLLSVCQQLTRENLRYLDYEVLGTLDKGCLPVVFYSLTWPFKTILALVINNKKISRTLRTIKDRLLFHTYFRGVR